MSYVISKGMKKEMKKLLQMTMIVSVCICLASTIIFSFFDEKVFFIFSADNEFIQKALENSKYFSITLFLNGIYYVLSEFLVVTGLGSYPFWTVVIMRFGIQFVLTYICLKIGFGIGCVVLIWIGTSFASICVLFFKAKKLYLTLN